MRVIAGEYRGRILKSPPDARTRPTSDRLRETLFNIIVPRIIDSNFLDLCAGTGAVGIEALSRGAGSVTFVDSSHKMCALVKENLTLCRVEKERTEIIYNDATKFLMGTNSSWDIVFFDPPYSDDYLPVISLFAQKDLLTTESLLIVEHHRKNNLPDEMDKLKKVRSLRQGDSCLSFYQYAVQD